MRRREFISLLGAVATAWPLMARAQQTMSVIGFLGSSSAELYAPALRTFRQGLGENGYAEDRIVSIEFRWSNGENELLPALAADLVRRQVNVIWKYACSGGSKSGDRKDWGEKPADLR
jgi:putative ABC transport system substrate-binding protein